MSAAGLLAFLTVADQRPVGSATIPILIGVFGGAALIWFLLSPVVTRPFWRAIAQRVAPYLHTGSHSGPGHVTPLTGELRLAMRNVRDEVRQALETAVQAKHDGVYWKIDPRRKAWKRNRTFLGREAPANVFDATAVGYRELERIIEVRGIRVREVRDEDDLAKVISSLDRAGWALHAGLQRLDPEEDPAALESGQETKSA